MTLFVTLNDDGTLALESDYGGSRSEFVTDSPDGPTEWGFKMSWGVPERTKQLVKDAVKTALKKANVEKAIDIVLDAVVEDFVDDR